MDAMLLRYTAICVFCLAGLGWVTHAQVGNVDVTGDLMLLWFTSANNYDFSDRGREITDEQGQVRHTNDAVDFARQEAHLYFTVHDLGGDNVMVRIGLEADRAFESGSLPFGRSGAASDRLAPDNDSSLDLFLEEAYVKIAQLYNSPFTVTLGRQFINLGDDPNSDNAFNTWWGSSFNFGDASWFGQRKLSDLGTWEIDPFDAVRLDTDLDHLFLSLIGFTVDETFLENDDVAGFAAWAAYDGFAGNEVDLYYILTDADARAMDGVDWAQHILGLRLAGDITEILSYKAELAHNWIDLSIPGDSAVAEGWAADLGLNLHPNLSRKPIFGVGLTWLEGDFGSDQQLKDYRFFFRPYSAKRYGELFDDYTFTNLLILSANGGLNLTNSVSLSSSVYYFLADDKDYTTLADPLPFKPRSRSGTGGSSDPEGDLGWEWDTYLDYQFNDEITMQFGGGIFFPGDRFKQEKREDDAYFMRGRLTVEF